MTVLATGYAWAEGGLFNAVDREDVYDEFETYSIGNAVMFDGGIGWAGFGMASTTFVFYLEDEFETYPAGTITGTLSGGAAVYWAGDGEFS